MTSPKPSRKIKADFKPNGETFRLLFANHPTPMLVYDLKTLAFLDVNEAALEKYSYTRSEFLKLTIKDICPTDAKRVARLIDNLEQKRPALQHSGERRHRLKNGQVIDVEITSHTLDFEGHKAALVMARDITERKRAEKSLRHNRDLLFALSLASQSVQQARTTEDVYRVVGKEIKALDYDLAIFTLSADHRHLTTTYATFVAGVLRAAEKLTGVRTQGYLLPIQPGSVFERVVDGERAEFLHQTAADAAKVLPQALRPLAEQLVTFLKVDKGIVAPLRVDGTTLGVLTVTGSKLEEGDVSAVDAFAAQVAISLKNAQLTQQVQKELNERKRAEEALRVAGQQWQTTFDAIGDLVCLINPEGQVVRHNRAMETFLGKSASEVDGHLCYELMHGTSEPVGNCPFLRTKQSRHRENMVFEFNGRWLNVTTDPILNNDEQFVGVTHIVSDITERKQTEEALKESERRFATIFRANPAAIEMMRLDDGHLVDVNAAWQRMTGYVHTEVVDRTPQELGIWVNPEQRERLIETLGQQGKAHGEMQLRCKSGEIRDLLTSADLIELTGKRYLLTMAQDITESKRAAEKLHESESLYQKMNENSPLGMHFYKFNNNHQLIFVGANPAADKLLGVDNSQFIGKTIEEAFPPLIQTEVPERYRDAAAKGIRWSTEQIGYEDGRITGAFDVRAFQTTPGNMVAVFADIAERKQMEEKLKESLSLLRVAEETAKLGGWSVDLETNRVTWSDEVAAIHETPLGFSPLIEEGISFYAPEWHERISKVFGDCVQQGIPYNEEMEIITAKGKRGWVQTMGEAVRDDKGKIIKVQGAFQDISARKQTEENLIVSEVRYRRLFEAAKDGILILDAETGVIVDVNPFLCEMLGFSHKEICGKELWEMGFFKDIAESKSNFLKLQQKEYIRYDDLPLEIANGRKFHVEFVSNVYHVNHHKVIQCNIRDITERKQAEQKLAQYSEHLEEMVEERTSELREAQEKLVRQEKLAVLGQLAGSVGHELRNPLAVINNALYYLKLVGTNGNEKVKEYLGIIQTEARTCEKIITDLLDFARIKSVDVEPVSVSKLAKSVLERYPLPKAVCLTLEIPENLPKLYVDPRQMEQVLGNLVINACQAMTTSGELTGGGLVITARQEQEMVAIAVQDTGVGIPPENMKKLFEPLFTTKAKGVGLGLAVSQKLVEANGGRIEVQSEAGVGSTFTLVLPVIHNG